MLNHKIVDGKMPVAQHYLNAISQAENNKGISSASFSSAALNNQNPINTKDIQPIQDTAGRPAHGNLKTPCTGMIHVVAWPLSFLKAYLVEIFEVNTFSYCPSSNIVWVLPKLSACFTYILLNLHRLVLKCMKAVL